MKRLTIGELKTILADISDSLNDNPVIIPVVEEDNSDIINGFRYVNTVGILEAPSEKDALCLAPTKDAKCIKELVEPLEAECKELLF